MGQQVTPGIRVRSLVLKWWFVQPHLPITLSRVEWMYGYCNAIGYVKSCIYCECKLQSDCDLPWQYGATNCIQRHVLHLESGRNDWGNGHNNSWFYRHYCVHCYRYEFA